MAKKPTELLVNAKVQFTKLPASRAVSTPTVVPAGTLLFTLKLLMFMVISLSTWLIERREESLSVPVLFSRCCLHNINHGDKIVNIIKPLNVAWHQDLTRFG